MRRSITQAYWFPLLIAAFVGCKGGSSPPVAPKASRADEAVDALIGAFKPVESTDDISATADLVAMWQAIMPHLAQNSRDTIAEFLAAVPEAQAHDALAKKTFGAALEKAEDYSSVEQGVSMMSLASVLPHIPPGVKAEVVKRVEKSSAEVEFRVRWSKGDRVNMHTFEDSLVAVQEGAVWKVLLPLAATVQVGSHGIGDKTEEYFRRKQKEWDAAAVRSDNETASQRLQAFRARIARLTEDLKAGKYRDAQAYLDAVNADSDERPPAAENTISAVDVALESFEATDPQLDARRSVTLKFNLKEGDSFHYESTFTTPPEPPRKHRSTRRIVKVTHTAVHEIDSITPDLVIVFDRRGYVVDVLEVQGERSIKDKVASEVFGIFGRLILPQRPVNVGDTWNAESGKERMHYRLVRTGTFRGREVAEIHSGPPRSGEPIRMWVELATGMPMRLTYKINNTTTVIERL